MILLMDTMMRLSGLFLYTVVSIADRYFPAGDIFGRAQRMSLSMSGLFAYQCGLKGLPEPMQRHVIARLKPQVLFVFFVIGSLIYLAAAKGG